MPPTKNKWQEHDTVMQAMHAWSVGEVILLTPDKVILCSGNLEPLRGVFTRGNRIYDRSDMPGTEYLHGGTK